MDNQLKRNTLFNPSGDTDLRLRRMIGGNTTNLNDFNNMKYSWVEHSAFEKAHQKTNVLNNEALEVHIALPNSLALEKEKLENYEGNLYYLSTNMCATHRLEKIKEIKNV